MGTAATLERVRVPSEQCAKATPSRDLSNQLIQIREIQLPWDMGLSDSSGLSGYPHSHPLLSPVGPHFPLIPFDGLDASSGFSTPYSVSTSLSELSDPHNALDMSSTYPASLDRYYQQRTPSSAAAVGHSSPMMLAQSYSHTHPQSSPHAGASFPQHLPSVHGTPSPPAVYASPMDEIERLRRMLRGFESQNHELHARCEQLQAEVNASRFAQTGLASPAETVASTFPVPLGLPVRAPLTPQMEASWRRRTDARIRKFCSPNRAGNALCAWHDTRRERRAFPPRMAPPGVLNCGCTVAEALFEESLARHQVGSYLPGDSVRMDPALRNPLLRLLEERYGYRDGDFERNPETGEWVEGEGHEYWEAELHRSSGGRHR